MEHIGTLPNLPRVVKKREADITPKVLEWINTNYRSSCAIEIKATSSNTIARSRLLPHQEAALRAACSKGGLSFKISDEARRQQPFDAFILKEVKALVVACFLPNRTNSVGVAMVFDVSRWKGASRYMNSDSGWLFKFSL